MRRYALALSLLALVVLSAGATRADAGEPAATVRGVAVDEFSYTDTSGEIIDQTAVHQKRLDAFMRGLRSDVAAERGYRLVSSEGSEGAAAIRVVGGIQKMSTLVQWAKIAVIDAAANRVLYEKLYTFRGDNDESWEHARSFVSREVRAVLATGSQP